MSPGIIVRDPATGQITDVKPLTLEEAFPTGRKLCASPYHKGPRWMHLHAFSPRGRWIQSWCRACQRIHARKPGNPPRSVRSLPSTSSRAERYRRWMERLRKDSERFERHKAKKRKDYERWMKETKEDPERYQEYLETVRIREYDRRRRNGVPERPKQPAQSHSRLLVDPEPFLKWFDEKVRYGHIFELTDAQEQRIRTCRRGAQEFIGLHVVDEVMSAAGDWDQVAVLYPHGSEKKKKGRKPKVTV